MDKKLLEVENLRVNFKVEGKEVSVVNGISFGIDAGETVGVVGESGCGKSITSLSIMGLIPSPPGRIADGRILYNGQDLLQLKESQMQQIRGNDISMIFQEPMTSLNPVIRVGKQLDEVILLHNAVSKKAAKERSIEMLRTVGIAQAEQVYASYPFQLSGGMRQRVMIAMGLACEPKLLIADEPTTALDVTIQAQILDLMRQLKQKTNTSILLITHDLGVVAEMCDYVVVMYAGEIVEEANVDTLFHDPQHPYTKGLLASIPKLGDKRDRLYSIPGQVPPAGTITSGCKFAGRCSEVLDVCRTTSPELVSVGVKHRSRCLLHHGKEAIVYE
ncbi:ABC transporter ATP-binding protein [Paenibacillus sp. MAH-36]|uniref:ABC transporter ATP-binding protein n=1 Tax=Paenibacillus violae TaxID=3077234 RepID=A0ABU3RKY5_9BACL|nr:ABC transporter ATP-binding protein [Paenibacillus sp. PFR10]MDU0204862.1 ABC transporter ATP-binding protein [Paenibacillus sp. PFR10]